MPVALKIGARLEFTYRLGDPAIVMTVVGVFGDAELGAQQRHACIFDLDRGLLLAGRREFKRRPFPKRNHLAFALAAQLGELRLQFAVELLWRVVAVKCCGRVLGGGDIRQHFGGISRMLRILDVSADLRPVHPAALRLTRVVQHAGGQLQLSVRQQIRRGRRSEIRHRIVGGIQAIRGGIPETRDDAFTARIQSAGLSPQRREFACGVKLLHRGAFGLTVEIAQRFGAQRFAQFVGDRLICRRDAARSLGWFRRGFG